MMEIEHVDKPVEGCVIYYLGTRTPERIAEIHQERYGMYPDKAFEYHGYLYIPDPTVFKRVVNKN